MYEKCEEYPEVSAVAEDRCPLNPSFYKKYCAHCQGTLRGTAENPHFSIREYFFRRNPMVELLKNGGPVHRHDHNFSFGCRKARIILACVPALHRFAWPSAPEDRTHFQRETFTEDQLGVKIEVSATMYPRFERGNDIIEKYWLKLRELPPLKIPQKEECCMTPEEFFALNHYWPMLPAEPREVHKGLGVMKCRAVCSVQDEIRHWLARRCR